MPELPEVETIRKGLEKYLIGKRVKEITVLNKKTVEGNIKEIIGSKVTEVKRRGKALIIDFDNECSLGIHIKLTGQFIYKGRETEREKPAPNLVGNLPSKFTRVIFKFIPNGTLFFNDIRKFAWMKLIKTKEIDGLTFFKELGPEPFKDLTFKYFEKILEKPNGMVKAFIMDQKKISGVGNIYANDALNLSGIDPRRKAKSLRTEEVKKLYDSIHEVLKTGLKYGGATEINYVNVLGIGGHYQEHFLAYSREGEKCKMCGGGIIKKIRVAGRGTYFCPNCQK